MSQVSRPVQIALLAVVVLGALYFLALRPHSQSGSSTPTPAPTPPARATSSPDAKAPGSSLPLGLGGLARAVAKAHGAVATSQGQANTLQHDSGVASSSSGTPVTTASASSTAPPASGTTTSGAPATAAGTRAATAPGTHTATRTAGTSAATSTSPAVTIKNELAAGKTVALLFWNPLSVDDQATYAALKALVKRHGTLVVTAATAGQVTDYGTIVTTAQVLETPTLLLMRGKSVETITDLQDPSDLRQYVSDIDAGGPGEVLAPKLTAYQPGTTHAAFVARGNAACTRLIKQGHRQFDGLSETTITPQQISGLLAYWRSFGTTLAAIPAPPADRGYVHTMLASLNRSIDEITQEIAAANAGNAYAVHNHLLSAETNNDLTVSMLINYGLTSCVGSADPNTGP